MSTTRTGCSNLNYYARCSTDLTSLRKGKHRRLVREFLGHFPVTEEHVYVATMLRVLSLMY